MSGSGTAEHFENVLGSFRLSPLRRCCRCGACADVGAGSLPRTYVNAETSIRVSPHTTVEWDCRPIAHGRRHALRHSSAARFAS